MQSKQYNQQYDQDKAAGGNRYIVSSTYAKIRDPSEKPDIQGVDVGK